MEHCIRSVLGPFLVGRTASRKYCALAAVMLAALLGLVPIASGMMAARAEAASTLDQVRETGDLRCGIIADLPGQSILNSEGVWTGFFVDFCKAVAAATLGNPDYVQFVRLTFVNRLEAMRRELVDVAMTGTTWTIGREHEFDVDFPVVLFYDGQGFLTTKGQQVGSLQDLAGQTVCVPLISTSETHLYDFRRGSGIGFEIRSLAYERINPGLFATSGCDFLSTDRIALATDITVLQDQSDYRVLPFVISREPLAPMIRAGDRLWRRIIRSVVQATILAEEKGITQANVAERRRLGDAETRRMLGAEGEVHEALGLSRDWAFQVIRAVGNYGEIYARHLGPGTVVNLERGPNRLWTNGGLHYAVPFQ